MSLDEALNRLTDRERAVIIGRFGLDGAPPKTLQAIAIEQGLTSRAWIHQIELKAIRKLGHPSRRKFWEGTEFDAGLKQRLEAYLARLKGMK